MTTKLAQVLRLDPPSELLFTGPYTEVITTKLHLHNPTENVVYFKVKTTAPKHYCVRPNSGIIRPQTAAEVNVLLQPVDSPNTIERDGAKHKFMIQSAVAPTDVTSVEDFWKAVDSSKVMDSKLRVQFKFLGVSNGTPAPAPAAPASAATTTTKDSADTSASKQYSAPVAAEPPTLNFSAGVQKDDVSVLRRRLDTEKNALETENRKLRDELMKATRQLAMDSDSGVSHLQMALLAFAFLLIGLILGKMF